MNDDEIVEQLYPNIHWRQPLTVVRAGDSVSRLCCRLCIAHNGLKASAIEGDGFETREEFDRHMDDVHRRGEV